MHPSSSSKIASSSSVSSATSRSRRRRGRDEPFQAAWEGIVGSYGRFVQHQVRGSLQRAGLPVDEVDDRVQEVYRRLHLGGPPLLRRLRRWSAPQAFTYLARTVERVVLDEVRAVCTRKRGGGFEIVYAGLLNDVTDRTVEPMTPEDLAVVGEARRLFEARCRALPAAAGADGERNVRVLRRALLEGWTSREIARAEAGLAASTVDSLVHRARRQLELELPARWHRSHGGPRHVRTRRRCRLKAPAAPRDRL